MKKKTAALPLLMVMTVLIMVFIVVMLPLLPRLLRFYAGVFHIGSIGSIMTALYISAPVGLAACVLLLILLSNIRKDVLFVMKNVTVLKALSWCCLFVGVEYIVIGFGYYTMLALGFAALFFGLILRVIAAAFGKAVELREENDFTV